jgi:hypothetical protein
MPAKIPEQLETLTLGSMLPGEVAWTLPWAMSVDEDGFCYLNSKYPIQAERGPDDTTMQMKVIRRKNGDYVVDLTQCYRQDYSRKPNDGSNWFAIPVEEVIS